VASQTGEIFVNLGINLGTNPGTKFHQLFQLYILLLSPITTHVLAKKYDKKWYCIILPYEISPFGKAQNCLRRSPPGPRPQFTYEINYDPHFSEAALRQSSVQERTQIDLSPYEWNFDIDKSGQKFHHSSKSITKLVDQNLSRSKFHSKGERSINVQEFVRFNSSNRFKFHVSYPM
jgi:hypothetical protein